MSDTVKTKVIGIDIGVKTTTVAVVDQRGKILAEESFGTTGFTFVNNFVEALAERVVSLAEANGGYESIRSVGISAPSSNYLTGCIENAPNLPWKGVIPLAAMLRDSVGLAVAIGNDAHAMALGENVYGMAHGMENFIIVTLFYGGVGSCFFSGGTPHLGFGGYAGEVGHSCVVDHGRTCNCGHQGCLEEYASERGIIQTAKELVETTSTPSLLRDVQDMTLAAVCRCSELGDELALEVWKRTGLLLGIALANYASIVNPEAVILTGEMTKMCKWLWKPAEASFREHVFGNIRDKVKFVVSPIDDRECNVLGASAMAWNVKEYSLFK